MKCKATTSDQQISKVSDQKYCIVAIFSTAYNTQICKVHKPKVGQRIDDLSNVISSIVILVLKSALCNLRIPGKANFFTKVQG